MSFKTRVIIIYKLLKNLILNGNITKFIFRGSCFCKSNCIISNDNKIDINNHLELYKSNMETNEKYLLYIDKLKKETSYRSYSL
jgi:hypothetical protein